MMAIEAHYTTALSHSEYKHSPNYLHIKSTCKCMVLTARSNAFISITINRLYYIHKVRLTNNSKQTLGHRGNKHSTSLLIFPTCCSLCAPPASQLIRSKKDKNNPLYTKTDSSFLPKPFQSERRQQWCHAFPIRRR